jgi:phosphoglycerate dehydrogenase-like enzyme
MRNASIDVGAAVERGVLVCGTAGLPYPTAELTWGLILALVRRIPTEDRATREGRWQVSCGLGLNGKTLGVIGLGGLGSRVAKVGRAFEMDVIAWSQNLTAARAAEVGATLVAKDDLLARADVVSIHLVLGDRTRGLIGARELSRMKRTAYLVNTSRGPIVDEAALVAITSRPSPAQPPEHGDHAASRLRDRGGISNLLRPGAGGRESLAGRQAGPGAPPLSGPSQCPLPAVRQPYAFFRVS